ncbi:MULTISPECIES: DUF2200 domain-containing protein [unclassified Agarivorans]|uniref:DUF2200 domain-containing protein n=1 Tax=unclassified Agarivorans TaxID=2636026 RepID=UPI0026E3194C|nr:MULTISPECIES: DUF2200 domain-containing protein [unclassified Agarivorans]MDO6687011.1 DUF2200 domain-containing protein [Agarivorans sp. 3_MG-2023]MDO6713577.1 DUF2200 domain-containing protein [Agarivorans sp. 2_MG-2023]MDO6765158.1 DUF2200 domain-containing protein [Agarivorans sp. 1_MG-2023]
MKTTQKQDDQIAGMTFSKIYPLYAAKVEKKGRTTEELNQAIRWLTGYSEAELKAHIEGSATFGEFFSGAMVNPNSSLITGKICGYKVEEIENPITQQARYLDKLVDELAKGHTMEKILRGS